MYICIHTYLAQQILVFNQAGCAKPAGWLVQQILGPSLAAPSQSAGPAHFGSQLGAAKQAAWSSKVWVLTVDLAAPSQSAGPNMVPSLAAPSQPASWSSKF